MTTTPLASPPAESFEAAMKELEGIVRDLEDGQLTLDQAVLAYERGMTLQQYCKTKLEEAKLKVETVTSSGTSVPGA